MVTQLAFALFVVCLSLQRLLELKKSESNRKYLLSIGAREHAKGQMPIMAALHATWLIAMLLEVFVFERSFRLNVFLLALIFFGIGQALRILAMNELKHRWCARVLTIPNAPPVTSGIFRYIRHPNYLGVILEIAAAPMLHNAYLTASVFSILNAILLFYRIRAEEAALTTDNNYEASFQNKGRFTIKS